MEQWKRNLFFIVLGQFFIRIIQTFILPYLPLFIDDLGVTSATQTAFWAGTIASASFLGQSLFSPFWGSFAHRYGRKKILLVSTVVTSFFTIIMIFAQSPLQLLVIRFLLGCFSGYNAAAIVYIGSEAPEKKMGYALGWLQTGQQAGLLIGPAVGGVLVYLWGLHGSCIAASILPLLIFIPLLFGIKEIPDSAREKNIGEKSQTSFGSLGKLGAHGLIFALFYAIVITQFSIKSIEPHLTTFVNKIYQGGDLELIVSGLFMAMAVSNIVLSPILGRYGDKKSHFPILFWCLIGAGFVTIGQIFAKDVWQLMAFRFVLGGFIAGILPAANALIAIHAPDQYKGSIFGLMASANAFGNFAGLIFGGSVIGLLDVNYGFYALFGITGILLLIGTIFLKQKNIYRNNY